MSSRLSRQQHDRLLKAIEEIHACRDLVAFPTTVVRVFAGLIESDSVSYNEVFPAIERSVTLVEPPLDNLETRFSRWKTLAHQHPIINYVRETGDGSAHQIADFLTTRQYHALELYRDLYRPLKVEHQMAVTLLSSPDMIVAVALNKERGRFSETARLLANHLRPHVARAYLNLVELQHLNVVIDGLSGALEQSDTAAVLWSHRRIVLHASARANELLARFFGWREGRYLPQALESWAVERLHDASAPEVFRMETAGSQLKATLAPRPQFHYTTIVLREERRFLHADGLQAFGLSPRQSEVLTWLAEGKSNEEIAVILGMNALTVKTHVREILRKMGVENRSTAAVRALELMRRNH